MAAKKAVTDQMNDNRVQGIVTDDVHARTVFSKAKQTSFHSFGGNLYELMDGMELDFEYAEGDEVFDGDNNCFVIPTGKGGKYKVDMQAGFKYEGSLSSYGLAIEVDSGSGATLICEVEKGKQGSSGAVHETLVISTILDLSEGDKVYMYVKGDHVNESIPEKSFMSIMRIGD